MHVIAGMHRSGTSFLSQGLRVLGADFGPEDELFPSDKWNQKGYVESIRVVGLNNRLILGDSVRIEDWLDAPTDGVRRTVNSLRSQKWKYLLPPALPRIEARGRRLSAELEEVHALYKGRYVKDPRFCLTLGAWAETGRIESIWFPFRNPTGVAASIKRREKLPLALGYRQWLWHVRSFWSRLPRDVPVMLVEFDRFFAEDTQTDAFDDLARGLTGTASAAARARLGAALDVELRHHGTPDEGAMPRDVALSYRTMRDLCDRAGGHPIYRDDVRDAVETLSK